MTVESVIIGVAIFFAATVVSQLISQYFNRKAKNEDVVEKAIQRDVEKLLIKVTDIENKISITNERTEMLFKIVNSNTAKIDKVNDEILELHKQLK